MPVDNWSLEIPISCGQLHSIPSKALAGEPSSLGQGEPLKVLTSMEAALLDFYLNQAKHGRGEDR